MESAQRYAIVQARIRATLAAAGRPDAPVTLIAVSKTQPAAKVRELYHLGQRDFGENYLRELEQKAAELADLTALRWHFIGHLQSNKLKSVARLAAAVHALADERHARILAREVEAIGTAPLSVYLAVNAGGEEGKSGVAPAAVTDLARMIVAECPALDVRGIMCIPPSSYSDPDTGLIVVPPLYLELAALAKTVGRGELSLGMSGDLGLALHAGATAVRIGTALFGARG